MINALESAAQLLAAARRSLRPGPRLPDDLRPPDIETALAIQRRVGEILGEAGGGWKCGAPSGGRTLAAPIFRSTISTGAQCAAAVINGRSSIEPEIAFVLAHDLPAREDAYTEDEVRVAIGEVRLALEILGSRYVDSKEAEYLEKLADNLSNHGLHLGPPVKGGLTAELSGFSISIDGVFAGQGRHPDGHPLVPLHWLANFLASSGFRASRGEGLRAGDVITTGSYAGALDAPPSGPLHAVFGELGEISVELVPAA